MQDRLPEPTADELAHADRLAAALRAEIAAHGPMPFARYMERCLYTPGLGYYSAGTTKFGAAGDFVTAPELGELFARCVVQATRPVLSACGDEADFLELGGGSGAFAEAALRAMGETGAWPRHYLILEPSADLRERQRERLCAALPAATFARVRWLDRPPSSSWRGVLFANEVVDALPVVRFAIRGADVLEEHVAVAADGRLAREDLPAGAPVVQAVRALERALDEPFADGYRSEWLPQLASWIEAVAGRLEAGLMLLVDYGFARREYYRPARRDGTLMAHYRHRAHADPLYLPGLNDLTASVDFTALADAGTQAGFALVNYLPQSAFLAAAGLEQAFEAAYAAAPDEAGRYRLAQQVRRLMLPEQMGERFQAMLFARGLDPLPLDDALLGEDPASRL